MRCEEGGRRGFYFTTKGNAPCAVALSWPENEAVITSLATTNTTAGKVKPLTLPGHEGELEFTQDATGLKIKMPAEKPCDYAYTLKTTGPKKTSLAQRSGSPSSLTIPFSF